MRSVVSLTNVQEINYFVECLILPLIWSDFNREMKNAMMRSFSNWLPNAHETLISFVFSLRIINDVESHSRTSKQLLVLVLQFWSPLSCFCKVYMRRRSTNPGFELLVMEQLRYSLRSEHQVENTVKNYAQRNRKTTFYSQLKIVVC